MNYTLSLTRHAAETLRAHLLGDRSREQMAITLCGANRLHRELRLLVRDVILLPPDAFRQQGVARLELKPEIQAFVHQRAHQHGLIQVDWHSHPGPLAGHSGRRGSPPAFSATDDHHEAAQAVYLAHRMDGVPYGSVVVNDDGLDARLWLAGPVKRKARQGGAEVLTFRPTSQPMHSLLLGDLRREVPASAPNGPEGSPALSPVYDRQVRAFGVEFQHRLAGLRVGLVGLGGLGSALADHLARLGVVDWVLVDPDVVELTNLNRLVNATLADAQAGRPKVYVARSTVRQSNPKARVRALQTDVLDPEALRVLKSCDLLIAATDNHASRMALNRLAVQYLIPLLHTGFHIGSSGAPASLSDEVPSSGQCEDCGVQGRSGADLDVSGEFALPDLGRWCLQCAGIVDTQQAGWELASEAQREILRRRGYVAGIPAPAVRHLDGVVASLAAAEVHNLVHTYKPAQRYLVYDAQRTELLPLQVTPNPACPVCSPDQGVLGLGDLEPLPDYRRGSHLRLPPAGGLGSENPTLAPASPSGVQAGRIEPATPGALQLAAPQPMALGDDDVSLLRPARVRRLQLALAPGGDGPDPDWP